MDAESAVEKFDEEIVNAITHGLGILLAVAGSVLLLLATIRNGTTTQIWGCAAYAATLLLTYLASTLSHLLREARSRTFMRAADQALIFLFIAGTYTPTALTWLHGRAWWLLDAAVWGVAIFGFLRKVVWTHRVELGTVSTLLYLMLGCMPAPMFFFIPAGLLKWIIGGGLCYGVGIVFFNYDHRVRYFHATWHLLVLAGSVCHYMGILLYCTSMRAGP
jgi:hemolysin III